MTLQASGAISLGNIKDEHGGGSTNIALGNYKKQDSHADSYFTYVVSWTGYHFQLNSESPTTIGSFFAHTHTTDIFLLLDSSVTVPVYVTTSITTDGSNQVSSGVSNNGSNYNTSSAYHSGSYTQIHIKSIGTATGGTGSDTIGADQIFLSTNQAQVQSGSDSSGKYWALKATPATGEVLQHQPHADLAFPSALSGGSEDAKVGGGTFFSTSSSSYPGLIKNGQSLTMKHTMEAAPGGIFPGSGNAIYLYFTGYQITRSDSNNHTHGQSFSALGALRFSKTGISGGWTNSGSGFASFYAANISSTPDAATGGFTTSGWSLSDTSSGSTYQCTLTNNTGNDYIILSNNSQDGTKNLPYYYAWGDSGGQFDFSTSNNVGTGGLTERYGQNLYSQITIQKNNAAGTDLGSLIAYGYHTSSANRATVITQLLELLNEYDGFGINGGDFRDEGITPGNSYGLFGIQNTIRAREPTTGTLRIFENNGSGSRELNVTYANYHTGSVFGGPTYGSTSAQGATNFSPTITKDGRYTGSDTDSSRYNAPVKYFKQNMKFSQYYDTTA